jgi:hypothetical protein
MEIPFHLRYQQASKHQDFSAVDVALPVVLVVSDDSNRNVGSILPSAISRAAGQVLGIKDDKVKFDKLDTSSAYSETFLIPVAKLSDEPLVEGGTFLVAIGGVLFIVLYCLFALPGLPKPKTKRE